jgi:thiol-disulfide isomerase/thioredoxin
VFRPRPPASAPHREPAHAGGLGLALLSLLLCLLLPVTAHAAPLEPFTTGGATGFKLPDLWDREHSLADYRGRVVLLNFWASWCPPCVYEMPELTRLRQRFAGAPFEVLAVNVGEKKYQVLKFVKLINFNLPVLLDTSKTVFQDFGLETLPTSFLIDAGGRVRYRVLGSPGWDDADTVAVVEQLLSEIPEQAERPPAASDNEARP